MSAPRIDWRVLTARYPKGRLLFQDEHSVAFFTPEDTGYLCFPAGESATAGAIGEQQGASLLCALQALDTAGIRRLKLWLHSAGAHFKEPLAGLDYLNRFLEALWAFRSRDGEIIVLCDGWLYGGMAMTLAATAHEVRLSEEAEMGLLGRRVLKPETREPVPAHGFRMNEPTLSRVPASTFRQGL